MNLAGSGSSISYKTAHSDFFFAKLSFERKESEKIFLLLFSSLKKVNIKLSYKFSFIKKI